MAHITMREAISQALWEEMERDPAIFILGEEVGVWGGSYAVTEGFYDHFGGERVRDTPIAEAAIVGAAIGSSLTGLRPIAELMTINFAFVAMDHIVNEAAKLHYMFGGQFLLPLVIRAVTGGGRQLGATHSQTPDVIFAHFPGLKVVSPGTPEDAKGMLKSAIRSNDPVLFLEHATMYQTRGEVPEGDFTIPLGQSKIQRPGKDVTIVTYSKGLEISTKAAEELAKEGIEPEIVDLRTLRPLDMEPVLESFKKTNRAVVVEEGWKAFGVGSEIASRIYEEAFDYVDAPIQRVAQDDVPLPYNRTLEQAALPQVEDESSAGGVVRKLLVDPGAVVPVGAAIAIVGTKDEKITEPEAVAAKQGKPSAPPASPAQAVQEPKGMQQPSEMPGTQPSQAPVTQAAAPAAPSGPVKASPLAKRI